MASTKCAVPLPFTGFQNSTVKFSFLKSIIEHLLNPFPDLRLYFNFGAALKVPPGILMRSGQWTAPGWMHPPCCRRKWRPCQPLKMGLNQTMKNDAHHNDIRDNGTQHKRYLHSNIYHDTWNGMLLSRVLWFFIVMLSGIMLASICWSPKCLKFCKV